tara:strand:- start:533 stop:1096 length:564 start_codon:yes stop_codon:yes gene_type:complete
MRQLLENWRRLINEKAFGTLSMPSGKLPNPCSQGEEQNGFHPDGTPFCRPKPELKGKNKITINTRQEIIYFIKNNPDQEIYLDNPKGTVKKFGGQIPIKLPFDYGEWINLINPEDGKGWDLIIVPSATKEHGNLIPCGYVAYNEKKPSAMGNDKIIIAPDGLARPTDRKIIKDVFSQMDYFDPVVWY